jgi:hypothetical protein
MDLALLPNYIIYALMIIFWGVLMEKRFAVLLFINLVLLAIFAISSIYLESLYFQPSYHSTHLTRTEYRLFTLAIQDWNYINGAFIPTSDSVIYLNYPALLFYVSFLVNGLFLATQIRGKKKQKQAL